LRFVKDKFAKRVKMDLPGIDIVNYGIQFGESDITGVGTAEISSPYGHDGL